ncbi:MAG: Sapep family Mn(2+)-dependent dipeptidase [Clostridia bacterium]|nr:Sapep family Mn(2+)-dependent dipeptidase [Clostridia bacterium]
MYNYDGFINDLKNLISFKSVQDKATLGAPFGTENKRALEYFLSVAKRFGFETINYDNYVGEVVFGNPFGQEIGIIGHLDVVPVGDGWDFDPFTLTEKDGYFYGRGVSDDKAGTLMALYALKELKDSGKAVNVKFRLFAGCNEESGWKDIEYLKTKTTLPEYGFSPDGDFPLSYAEKGMYEIKFTLPKLKNFSLLKGGTVVNAVCDYACCMANENGIDLKLIKKHGLSLKNGNVIESFGKSAHGSHPDTGVNALKSLFNYFLDMGENVKSVVDYIMNDKSGIFALSNEQGNVTFSPDLLSETENGVHITADMRIPAPFGIDTVKEKLDAFGIDYKVVMRHPPVMVEKDGWFVKTLLSSYSSVTGDNARPISLSGSTFARAFDKGVAFGTIFPNSDATMHCANEKMKKEELLSAYEIYKKAVFELADKI